jgi:Rps23 Pro-64 3,4-dihydroxylase Tpa1-like proline 4-hydroxylase
MSSESLLRSAKLRYTGGALDHEIGKTLFDFPSVQVERNPFPHFSVSDFCDPAFASRLLHWFESGADWKSRRMANFYVYSDINLRTADLPTNMEFLVDQEFLTHLRQEVGSLFGAKLDGFVDVTAHRLAAGDRIRTHSDWVTLRFTHRMLLQVNQGWKPGNGGVLGLLDRDPKSGSRPRVKSIVPHHRSGFAFEVSEKSFHKVSRVNDGERYTLIFSFYPPQPPRPASPSK